MESTINANLNNADCLKAISNIGSTTYQNVCNGTYSNVPWGAIDYVIGALGLFAIIGIGIMVYKFFTIE